MKIHLLSGFLGSGKTTAILQAAQILIEKGIKTGVVTNDQGTKLVDGGLFKNLAIPNREVISGCFCCNYDDLDASITSLIETDNIEVIFAESVGSCTDIVATVLKPLLQFRPSAQVTVSIFADVRLLQMILKEDDNVFDESVRYIYLKQLEEAGIIVINKIDLADGKQLAAFKDIMQEGYGDKVLLYQDSLNKDSIQQWLNVLDNYKTAAGLQSLKIDYDIYAEGESKLAWVDQVLEIFSTDNTAIQIAEDLINEIYYQAGKQKYPIGHLKFLVNNAVKISFTSATDSVAVLDARPSSTASLLINMRVQTLPGVLTQLVHDAVIEMELQTGCKIIVSNTAAFQPGYPQPEHRM
jgi:Ni2+-binding GTPase involved in maturation of urease and hydrogenase